MYSPAYECIPDDPRCDPTSIPSDITVQAQRGDNILEVGIHSDQESPVMGFSMSRATPWTAYPAGVAGFLPGAAGGWIPFGWASRRLEHGNRVARALATALLAFTMFLWWAPVLLFAPRIFLSYLRQPELRWAPPWQWLGQPTLSLPFLLGCATVGLALGLAALPRPERADRTIAHG